MATTQTHDIIIADNYPIVVSGLKSFFATFPDFMVVGVADNGGDLLEMLSTLNADTLIIDFKLPRTNIYRLIKDLVVLYPNLKIIAFTDYTSPKLVQDMMDFGVSGYIAKHAPLQEIIKVMQQAHQGEQVVSPTVFGQERLTSDELQEANQTLHDNFTKFTELTEREMDIIILLSRGMTNNDMAEKLNLSKYTIETHRKNVMKKLQLKTSAQLIYFATQQGLV